METKEIADKIRDAFALGDDDCVGVMVKGIGNDKFAVPIQMKDGSKFGVVVEKIL